MRKIIYILTLVIIIAGLIVTGVFGLKYSLDVKPSVKLQIDLKREFDEKEIKSLVEEVLQDEVKIEKVETLGEILSIKSNNISEEQLEQIIAKLNEKYETEEYTIDATILMYVPNTRVRDLVSRYILPLALAGIVSLVYIIVTSKNKLRNVILMICSIILSELLLLSLVAILRITVDKSILMTGVITFMLTVTFLTITFISEKENTKKQEEKLINRKDVLDNLMISIISVISSIGILIIGLITNKEVLTYCGIELIIGIIVATYVGLLNADIVGKKIKE